MSKILLESKIAEEILLINLDFTSGLRLGIASSAPHTQVFFDEGIASATVTVQVYSGVDSSPSSLVSGASTTTGGVVQQKIIGGLVGVVYLLTITAITNGALNSTITLQNQTLVKHCLLTILSTAT